MNQFKITSLCMLFLLASLLITCNKQFKQTNQEKTIKIGVLGDLSGDYVNLIRGIPRCVEFAVEDIKKEVDREIQLIIEDQESCNTERTVTIMNKFTKVDQVDFIIGGSCSNTTLSAAPIANQSKTIMISPSSSAPSVSQAGEYVFRTYISDILRGKEAVRLMYEQGKRRMALITDIQNDAYVQLAESGKQEFIKLGGEIVAEEEVTSFNNDFKSQLVKIGEASPDFLYMGLMNPNQAGIMIKQLRELNINIQLIVPGETIEDPIVVETAGEAANSLIYVMPGNPPHSEKYQELKIRYKEKYGEEEIPMYFLEAYDATILGVKAVLASDGTKEDIKNKLYEVSKTYQGVSGSVEFDENGDVHKDVMFKTIKDGKFVEYAIGD